MDLRLMEIFNYVYEEMSFSRAAQRLGLTQPTISGHIKALERSCETQLFDRLGREIAPTRAGELLHGYSCQIVELKRGATEAMNRFLNRLQGRLVLGASTIPGEYLLPTQIARFRESYPQIEVSLIIRDTRAIAEGVRTGVIDLGFVGARLPDPGLSYQPFASDEVILVVPPSPAWAAFGDRITLEQLRQQPLLVREEGSGTRLVLERHLAEQGLTLGDFRIVAELGSTTAIKESVKNQLGASFLSRMAVEDELRTGLVRQLEAHGIASIERDFYSVVNIRRASSPLREAFLDFIEAPAEHAPRETAIA